MMHYKETQYGFEYGAADVQRFFSDEKKGWITIGIRAWKDKEHTKVKDEVQVYVTKTGKIRVHRFSKELK